MQKSVLVVSLLSQAQVIFVQCNSVSRLGLVCVFFPMLLLICLFICFFIVLIISSLTVLLYHTYFSLFFYIYHRIPKVTAPITFGISSPKGQQLLGSSYFRVAVTFGQLKFVRKKLIE